jgi:hypothetical protein
MPAALARLLREPPNFVLENATVMPISASRHLMAMKRANASPTIAVLNALVDLADL